MSDNKPTPLVFFDFLKSDKSKGYIIIFSLIIAIISVLFFKLIDHSNSKSNDNLLKKVYFDQTVGSLNDELEKEVIATLQHAFLFGLSNAEIDRVETIYALKNIDNLYIKYRNVTLSGIKSGELDTNFNDLQQVLSDFGIQVGSTINQDGKLTEILDNLEAHIDSTKLVLSVDVPISDLNVSDVKALRSSVEEIRNQLFMINNQIHGTVQSEIQAIKHSPIVLYVVFTLIILLLLLILYRLLLQNQNAVLSNLSGVLDNISKGELPEGRLNDSDALKGIGDTSNRLVHYLDDASQFAIKIGDGDFDYEFKPKSENDALGNSLIEMRNRLQEVAHEDKIRNWINEGQAKFGEILRVHGDDIETLGNTIIVEIVEYLNANQGALFVIKQEGEESFLELLATYAHKRKKHIEKRIEIGEGLAGQSYQEGKSIYLTDVKTDHYNIQTGLGESRPSSLLIVPLKREERIEGIIEIASLQEMQKHQIEFLEDIGASIASSLTAGKVNQTTKRLLEETQQKAEQMKAQEEELRQNMEELAATQEQMERRNKEMEEIQQQLSEEKYLLNALLNSTHDRIYFKDKDSKFIRVSHSMLQLFDKQEESEVVGKSDFDFGFEEHAKVAYHDEQEIIRTGKPLVDAVEKEQWDDGKITWVSTTKNPLRDMEGNIIGTFGISRDITRSKEVELEMIKSKNWFENFFQFHPVGFLVLNQYGQISFATKSILSLLGISEVEGLTFEKITDSKSFNEFLTEIEYEEKKDQEIEISLTMKDKAKSILSFLTISGSKENEDGTKNIFLIQQ